MKQKFSKNIIADEDAYYMSCPEKVAEHLAKQLSQFKTAVELCTAVGITAIQLAKIMEKVIAVDKDDTRIVNAKKNAKLYAVENKIEFIAGNVLDKNLLKNLSAEIAVLDPDWSVTGMEKSAHVTTLDNTQPSLRKMFELTKKYITPNIVIRIPNTFTFETLFALGPCKIENIIWGGKTKFKFAYYLNDIKDNNEADFSFDL